MSPFNVGPLDPEIADLLQDARADYARDEAPAKAREAVLRRVELSIAGTGSTAAAGGGAAEAGRGGDAGEAGGGAAVPSSLAKHVVLVATSLAVGGAAGAVAMHRLDARDRTEARPAVTAPIAAPPTEPPRPLADPSVPSARVAPKPESPSSRQRAVDKPAAQRTLVRSEDDSGAERRLLDAARAALSGTLRVWPAGRRPSPARD